MIIEESLSYDDVLLLPSYADFLPGETDVTCTLCPDVVLNVPLLTAAMDTVTEQEMAIAVALHGGVGVIHRNMAPAEQARQVRTVKRHLNWIIESPLTVEKDRPVRDVWDIMGRYNISGLPVVEDGKLCGIITSRDMRFCRDLSLKVGDVMTADPIVMQGKPDIDHAKRKFDAHKIEKLPVVDDNGALTGLITVKDIEKHNDFPHAATDANGRLLVGAAIPPVGFEQRIELLADARVDFFVIDAAHGDTKNVAEAVAAVKTRTKVPVIGGNIATREGAKRLIDAGADAIKVGVGPGSICTTRVVAGIGVPQFTAVVAATEEANARGVPVIADGGIKYSGDITKALAAGASAVMIGNLFAGLKESPGTEIIYEGRIFKSYRGMGSLAAIQQGSGDRYQMNADEDPVPEGIEGRVPYKGELKPFLHQLVTGLRKGMGYCGCRNLEQLRSYRKFIKITAAGLREGHVHDVSITQEPPNYSR